MKFLKLKDKSALKSCTTLKKVCSEQSFLFLHFSIAWEKNCKQIQSKIEIYFCKKLFFSDKLQNCMIVDCVGKLDRDYLDD